MTEEEIIESALHDIVNGENYIEDVKRFIKWGRTPNEINKILKGEPFMALSKESFPYSQMSDEEFKEYK